jgi:alkylation response protein AidB-like acyl-CoA dehydrogenase
VIDLIPDDDEQQLIDAAHAFLAGEMGRAVLRSLIASGQPFDPAFLRRCGEQGWFALALPVEAGGVGQGVVAEALVFRELGRFLVPGPVLPTALGAAAAAEAGDPELAGRLSSGEALAGLGEVLGEGEGAVIWDPAGVDVMLIVDRQASSVALVDAERLTLGEAVPTIDPLVHMVRLDAESLPPARCTLEHADALIERGTVLCSAMLVGIAEEVRDDAAAYAAVRVQFGRPIGAFQAVKHRSADMAVRAEAGWAQTIVAALRLDQAGSGAGFDVSAAKVLASDGAIRNARDNIQNHGGIGFTAEHDAHLFLKRAHILDHLLGPGRDHARTTLSAEIGW